MKFDKSPAIRISDKTCFEGWATIIEQITNHLNDLDTKAPVVAIECYQGVDFEDLKKNLVQGLKPNNVYTSADYFYEEQKIRDITQPDVTDDRIFGRITELSIHDFIDDEKLNDITKKISAAENGLTVILGTGASQIAEHTDVIIYADMARWEIQHRMRNQEVSNIGINNLDTGIEDKYKRGFFVDWRVCDHLKKEVFDSIDFVLDTNKKDSPKLIDKETYNYVLEHTVTRPFSLVPFFDPGPWGGQWMREVCDLSKEPDNFAWCFNCIPEENSVHFQFDNGTVFEMPSLNVVFFQSKKLLGEPVYEQFGDEFPIRFDFLDTVEGGKLSLQVHPSKEYIKEEFGMNYTQNESYYMLDATDDALVYLGVKKGIDPEEMIANLKAANKGEMSFNADNYVQTWPTKKHDHMLIPNGTVHCSAEGCMVLEISATPYIFTFKLWDWGRLGLDGKPRPINVERGEKVIRWDLDEDWAEKDAINQFELLNEGDGWTEERTGLQPSHFMETRRHWFSKPVTHKANGSVAVFNLVEGKQAVVSSPNNEFEPYMVNYAETFVVPAHIQEYVIFPAGESEGEKIATIKAFVRT